MAQRLRKQKRPLGAWGPERGGCRVTGVMGLGRKTGATHFTMWAAGYLAAVRQRRTAVIEWSGHGDFARLETVWNAKKGAGDSFKALDMTFYKAGGTSVLAACMEGRYDEVLIDFGQRTREREMEWLRCDLRIATAALSDWQLADASGMMELGEELGRGWTCLAAFGSEGARMEAQRKLGISVIRIPFSADAFKVDRKAMEWFEKVL